MSETTATGTMTLDFVTLAKALGVLSDALGLQDWTAVNKLQEAFLAWYYPNRSEVDRLSGLKTEASNDAEVLNKFLTDHGFQPLFRPIPPNGMGAAAILDMLVRWVAEAKVAYITRVESGRYIDHRAFELSGEGIEFFEVPGQEQLLARLATQDGGAVWLMMAQRPSHGVALAETAVAAMEGRRQVWPDWTSVRVPTLEIDATTRLDWMLGLYAGRQEIVQAFQMFKLRMNEHGARVKVATGLATRESLVISEALEFDRPFIGWFTKSGSELPIAAFYADEDSWQEPAGELEEL